MRFTRAVPFAAAALGLVLGASACGDSTAVNTITMSQTEAAELFAEMSEALGGTGVSMDRTSSSAFLGARAPGATANTAATINVTANCSNGGTVTVSGSVNPSGTTGASFDVTEAPKACQTAHFTLDGSFKISGSVSSTQTSVSFNETVKGSLNVKRNADGTSGTCAINFTVNGSVNTSTFASTITASGTICGLDASAIVTT